MNQTKGCPELVLAAITFISPNPPPIDDEPPFPVFMMSIGIIMGKLLEQGKFRPADLTAAANWIGGKKSVQEVIQLIWNR